MTDVTATAGTEASTEEENQGVEDDFTVTSPVETSTEVQVEPIDTTVDLSTMGIGIDVDSLTKISQEIDKISTLVAAARGQEGAGRVAIRNAYIRDNTGYAPIVEQLTSHLADKDVVYQIGFIYGVHQELTKKFEEVMDAHLDAEAAKNKVDTPDLNNDQVAAYVKKAQNLGKVFDSIYGVLELQQVDLEAYPKPSIPRSGGGKGSRGIRTSKKYQIGIAPKDDPSAFKVRQGNMNTLSSVAHHECGDLNWNTSDLKKWMEQNGWNWKDMPTEEWKATLPNGKVMRMVNTSTEEEYVEEGDEGEEGEDNE